MFGIFGVFSKIKAFLAVLKWVVIIAIILLVIFFLLRAYGKLKKSGFTLIKSGIKKRKKKNDLDDMGSF